MQYLAVLFIFEVFPGAYPLFRGAWGPILQLDPPIFFCSYVSPYHKGPESAIIPKIYSSTDNPLKFIILLRYSPKIKDLVLIF